MELNPQGPRQRVKTRRVPKALKGLWGSLLATSETFSCDGPAVLRKVATELYESFDSPISLSCEILLRYNEFEQLARKEVDPLDYNTAHEFFTDKQSVDFLRKVPFEIKGVDRREAAKKKFLEAEEQCRITNKRIRSFLENPDRASMTVRRAFCLSGIAVKEVLGTRVSPSEWLSSCRFGPGAFNHPQVRGLTSVYDKLQVTPSVTSDFRDMGAMLVTSSPSWGRSILDIEDEGFWPFVSPESLKPTYGNRVTFVPKTAVTDRAIAIEPLINIYAQLGLGQMVRKRLKAHADIDLNEQWFNQELAREGSLHGFLSTIDLSSASDTVAKELVRSLLPEEWFHAMDACRSKIGELDGNRFYYEKFSSMGNGFTFELESLLFWAFARSACVIAGCPEMVSVYGDDIVVPVDAYETLEEILTFFGFSLNKRKSFRTGQFRESCGKDYYNGSDVRPFLQKELPEKLENLLTLANGLRRVASRMLLPVSGCDMRYRRPYECAVREIPPALRTHLRVPAHAGDSDGLISNWDEAQSSSFVRYNPDGWEGYDGIRLSFVSHEQPHCSHFEGGVASLLYRAKDGFGDAYTPATPRQGRDGVFKLRNGAFWGPWTDVGPWN